MGKLTNLTKLSLDGNDLEELPEGIGSLCSLRYLWLDDNRLQSPVWQQVTAWATAYRLQVTALVAIGYSLVWQQVTASCVLLDGNMLLPLVSRSAYCVLH